MDKIFLLTGHPHFWHDREDSHKRIFKNFGPIRMMLEYRETPYYDDLRTIYELCKKNRMEIPYEIDDFLHHQKVRKEFPTTETISSRAEYYDREGDYSYILLRCCVCSNRDDFLEFKTRYKSIIIWPSNLKIFDVISIEIVDVKDSFNCPKLTVYGFDKYKIENNKIVIATDDIEREYLLIVKEWKKSIVDGERKARKIIMGA